MKKQYPADIVLAIWDRINTSPYITLGKPSFTSGWHAIRFGMHHSKTGERRVVSLLERDIHRLDDPWTYKYISEQLTLALTEMTRNSAEAGVSSIDVYRDDYPA